MWDPGRRSVSRGMDGIDRRAAANSCPNARRQKPYCRQRAYRFSSALVRKVRFKDRMTPSAASRCSSLPSSANIAARNKANPGDPPYREGPRAFIFKYPLAGSTSNPIHDVCPSIRTALRTRAWAISHAANKNWLGCKRGSWHSELLYSPGSAFGCASSNLSSRVPRNSPESIRSGIAILGRHSGYSRGAHSRIRGLV